MWEILNPVPYLHSVDNVEECENVPERYADN